jgi:hypothetical protein
MTVKNTDLCKKFEKYIINNELNKSIRYGIVLNVNNPTDFWNKIIEILGKHINIKNILMPIYLINKYDSLSNEKILTEQENKNTIVDIICMICLSEKNIIKTKKINKDDLLTINFSSKISTNNFNILNNYINVNSNDISDYIKIGLNEVANLIHSKGDIEDIIYWVEWLKKQKNNFKTSKNISNISTSLSNDWVWIIWDIIFNVRNDLIIRSLFKLYKINYKKSERNKRFFIIYYSILLINKNVLKNTKNSRNLILPELNYLRIQMSCKVNYYYKSLNIFFNNNKNVSMQNILKTPNIFESKQNIDTNSFLNFIEKNDDSFNKKNEIKKDKKDKKNKKDREDGYTPLKKENGDNMDTSLNKKEIQNEIQNKREIKYKNEFDMIDSLLNY